MRAPRTCSLVRAPGTCSLVRAPRRCALAQIPERYDPSARPQTVKNIQKYEKTENDKYGKL